MGVVAAESLVGFICPLTMWEDQLRLLAGARQRYAGSFIQHWLHPLIFFDVGEGVFTAAYLAFFLAVVLSFWLVPPALAAPHSSFTVDRLRIYRNSRGTHCGSRVFIRQATLIR